MKILRRFTLAILACILTIVTFATVVMALDAPTSQKVYAPVKFYQDVRTPGDTLVIGKYNINYVTEPDETATETFLILLLDDDYDILGSAVPYAYYNDGYDGGGFSIYVESRVTWEAEHKIRLVGNPTANWSGGIPLVDMDDITWNASNSGLPAYVLTLAKELDLSWGASYDLVDPTASGDRLTTQGVTYFTSIIANLRTIAPSVFPIATYNPQFLPTTPTRAWETELLGIWDLTGYDTYFTDLAAYIETDAGILKLMVFGVLLIVVVVVIVMQTHQAWSIPILMSPTMYFGNCSGLLPLAFTMLTASAFIILGVFVFFYRRASA